MTLEDKLTTLANVCNDLGSDFCAINMASTVELSTYLNENKIDQDNLPDATVLGLTKAGTVEINGVKIVINEQ